MSSNQSNQKVTANQGQQPAIRDVETKTINEIRKHGFGQGLCYCYSDTQQVCNGKPDDNILTLVSDGNVRGNHLSELGRQEVDYSLEKRKK